MRSLSAALLAAQRSASREPYVAVLAENSMAGIRRLDFTQLNATANTIGKHDVCVAGDGSVTRVRSDNAGNLLRQRNTTPGTGSGYAAAWTTFATAKGNQIACAAKGARVVIVYVDAAATAIKLIESTDNGATYGAEVAVTTAAAAVSDLAVAYKTSAGDLAIAWVTATTLNIIKRAAGAFGAASPSGKTFSGTTYVAMTYGFDWDLVVTGTEVTTLNPTLWTIVHGDGNDAPPATWGALDPQQQAENNSLVTYKAPSIVFTDTYHIDYTEADAFTGGATRVYRTTMHPAMNFAAGPFTLRAPVPVDYTGAQGLAIAADAGGAGYVYEAAPDAVYRAAQSAVQSTLTTALLAIHIDEDAAATRGYLDLDNTAGTYKSLTGIAPPAPLVVGNLVGVSWGYRTTSGLQASRMADLWIAATEYLREGGKSILRLHVEGGWELLRRNRQRNQVVHTADTYLTILLRICSRAGVQLTSSAVSSRAQTVTPKFTIAADASAYESVARALAFLADRVRMRTVAGALITEPLTSDASVYEFADDGSPAAHPARAIVYRGEPPAVAEAQAFGSSLAFGESIDYANAAQSLGTRDQQRDITSASSAAATATAVAHLRQRALDGAAGQLVIAPNVGQELLDPIDFLDAQVSDFAVYRRVAGIRWRYDKRRALYEQTLVLGAM